MRRGLAVDPCVGHQPAALGVDDHDIVGERNDEAMLREVESGIGQQLAAVAQRKEDCRHAQSRHHNIVIQSLMNVLCHRRRRARFGVKQQMDQERLFRHVVVTPQLSSSPARLLKRCRIDKTRHQPLAELACNSGLLLEVAHQRSVVRTGRSNSLTLTIVKKAARQVFYQNNRDSVVPSSGFSHQGS